MSRTPTFDTSESARLQFGNLDEIKTSVRKEIMSDQLSEILAENQKEMPKLVAPNTKKILKSQKPANSDCHEEDNTFISATSTSIRSKRTAQNNTQLTSRNNRFSNNSVKMALFFSL